MDRGGMQVSVTATGIDGCTKGEIGGVTPSCGSRLSPKNRLVELITDPGFEEAIVDSIDKDSDLPIASTTVQVLGRLTSAVDTSVTELANIVLKDYGLTSKILKLVNSVHYMRFGEVTTVSRAILLLGIENIRNMVITMSLLEKLQRRQSPYLPGLLSKTIFAALVGEQIAKKLKYSSPEEAFLCSLFYQLGEIVTAHYAPEQYAEIQALLSAQNGDTEDSRALLQGLYRQIGMRVAEEWRFPGKVVLCMNRVNESEVDVKSESAWLHCICSAANNIADIAGGEENGSTKQQRLERMFEFFGSRFNRLKESLDQITTASKENLDKYYAAYGIDFQRFSLCPESTEAPKSESNKEKAIEGLQSDFLSSMMVNETKPEETPNPEVIFANGMRDIARTLLGSYEMEDIFTITMETIYRGLRSAGIKRTILVIRNTKKPFMDVRLAVGDSALSLREWFIVPITSEEDDIFNVSFQRQKDLLIKDTSSLNTGSLLPPWLLQKLDEPVFIMILPIMVKGKAIGMIYIEGEKEGLPNILPTHFHYIKLLHDQAIFAIRKKSGV